MPSGTPANSVLSPNSPVAHHTRSRQNSKQAHNICNNRQNSANYTIAALHNTDTMGLPYAPFHNLQGENPTQWLEDFIQTMVVNGVKEEQKLALFSLQLKGSARTWYDMLPADKKDTFTHASEAFKDNFKPPASELAALRKQLHMLQQQDCQTGKDFINMFLLKAMPLNMGETQLVNLIIDNLHPSIQLVVRQADPKTLQSLLAQPACHVMPAQTASSQPPAAPATQQSSGLQDMSTLEATIRDLIRNEVRQGIAGIAAVHTPETQQNHSQPSFRGQHNQQKFYCIGCGKYCFLFKGRCNSCPASSHFCEYCGIKGHFASVCHRRMNNMPPANVSSQRRYNPRQNNRSRSSYQNQSSRH